MTRFAFFALVAAFIASIAVPARAGDVSPLQQLFVLKEIRPDIERVGIVWHRASADRSGLMSQVERAAASTGVRVFVSYADDVGEIANAYRELVRQHRIQAVWIVDGNDVVTGSTSGRDFLIRNTASQGIPLVAPDDTWVEAGAHMSFFRQGSNIRIKVNRRAADAARLVIPDNFLDRTDFFAAN
jgi:ABC-type uncharacterized transport system substrate-binding protein